MTSPPAEQRSGLVSGWIGAVREGWNRFWFRPGDPSVLGLMRICCGLIALYVHIVYCFHLSELFGADGWLNLSTANLVRRESPTSLPPSSWDDEEAPPEYLPDDPEAAKRILAYYDRWEIDPRQAYSRGQSLWSVWFHVTDPSWMAVIHAAYLVVLVLFTAGYRTRITSVLAWAGALGYMHRAPMVLFGMDTILGLVLLYLMIGPSGAALSVDRLLERYRASRKVLAQGLPPPSLLLPAPQPLANLALRLMQVHLCFIYLAPGLAKLQGGTWWNGTALWPVMAGPEYAPFKYPFYHSFLRFLLEHRWLWEIFMSAGMVLTMVVEIGFPFLAWYRRLRWPMIVLAWMLHLGIGLFMGLMTFSLIMMVLVSAFVPPEAVHRLVQWLLRGRARLRLLYDRRVSSQVRAAAAVHAFDVAEQVTILQHQNVPRIVGEIQDPSGEPAAPVLPSALAGGTNGALAQLQLLDGPGAVLTGHALYERLVRSLRLLWPLALWAWIGGMVRGRRASPPDTKAPPVPPIESTGQPSPAGEKDTAVITRD